MAKIIAYLIHSFPEYSSTFINDEIDEMRAQGEKEGRLFETGSAQSLFKRLLELIRNETIRKHLGTQSAISAKQIDLQESVKRFRQLFVKG